MFAGLVIAFDVILILFWVVFLAIVMGSVENIKSVVPMFKLMVIGTTVVIILNIIADKI